MSGGKVKRLVAFAVLMESGSGVLSKSPSCVLEKFELVLNCSVSSLHTLMDMDNQAKYKRYLKEWRLSE